MAESLNPLKKRGRPKLTDSQRKRRYVSKRVVEHGSRINLGSEIRRWTDIKTENGLKSDREVATFLIDSYKHNRAQQGSSLPGMSRLLTSTPAGGVATVRTPSVSEVSGPESSGDREVVQLSGVEEMQSEESAHEDVAGPSKHEPRQMTKKITQSFIDPFDISIDITQLSEPEQEDSEDPDYEPSVLIEAILPEQIDKQSEDVAFEEAEFGFEAAGEETEEETESEDDTEVEGVTRAKTEDDCDTLTDEDKCIAFVSQLKALTKLNISSCKICGSKELELVDSFVGSALYFKWVCKDGHVTNRWSSQPVLNRRLHSGDFLICSTILISGNNYGKMGLWAKMLYLKFPSADKFHKIQGRYLCPCIDNFWTAHQEEVLSSFSGQDIVVLGDGRNDTPGHSAQYCSYTLMEQETKKILTLKTLDKRMTERKSVVMEKTGFQSAMEELRGKHMQVKEVVTDAHLGIGALMKSQYQDVKHSHDIWHVAKNLGKKLSKISQKKQNSILQQWNKDIVNHFWFVCKTAETYAEFVGLWSSLLHHIVDQHEWILPHGDNGISSCLHGPLVEEEKNKPWLNPKTHAPVIKDLANVVLDKRLLGNVGYYLNFRTTADLEGFHQHILMYCAKRFSYTPPVYRVRNLLAAIDNNMHVDRPVVYNKDGTLRLQRVWNKKSGRWAVYPKKSMKEYKYVDSLLSQALQNRLSDKVGMYRKREMEADDPRRISKHLAPVQPKPTRDIYQEQQSRFK